MTCHACEGLPDGTCALRASLRGQLRRNYDQVQPKDNRMKDKAIGDLEAVKRLALERGISIERTYDKKIWYTSVTASMKQGLDTFPECSNWFISYLRVLYFFRTFWDQA